jgi:hypothetical protein
MSMGNRSNFSREAKLQYCSGLDLEKRNLASGRGRTFFLTSLFIELIDRMVVHFGRFGTPWHGPCQFLQCLPMPWRRAVSSPRGCRRAPMRRKPAEATCE